ncbi:hypothetical protein DV701_13285 [Ornithinimicrobium avium]|uniref:MobA-like NTP transferase domain-containing protein n=2 Tax=Ornithinimicrobium avium TaxID=2283195 RepID=A0A345NPK4_9MICO|nr:hypothetical protein DV701_13285 [Ornithinimicrobium avium]
MLMAQGQKGLTPLLGQPLINYTVGSMAAAGIGVIYVATWPENELLFEHLRSRWSSLHFELVRVELGGGTGQAMLRVLVESKPGPIVVGTADTVMRTGAVTRLLEDISLTTPGPQLHLLVTHYVEDEDPIWVHLHSSGLVTAFSKGIPPSSTVFANVRWLSSAGRTTLLELCSRHEALRAARSSGELVRALIADEYCRVTASVEDPVFDIDRDIDALRTAEWIASNKQEWERLP